MLGYRCPGTECPNFQKAAGETWEEKAAEACTNCTKCKGNFPLNPDDVQAAEDEEADTLEIVDEIEALINDADAGAPPDFERMDFAYFTLFRYWRGIEKQIENLRQARIQVFLRGWMETGKK